MTSAGTTMNAMIFSFQNDATKAAINDTPIIRVPVPTALPYFGISSSLTFLRLQECIVLILPIMFTIPITDMSTPKIIRTILSKQLLSDYVRQRSQRIKISGFLLHIYALRIIFNLCPIRLNNSLVMLSALSATIGAVISSFPSLPISVAILPVLILGISVTSTAS